MTAARRLGGAVAVTTLVLALLGLGRSGPFGSIAEVLGVGGRPSIFAASASTGQLAPVFEPVLGLPATNVTVIGASPGEAAGEAWAYGTIGDVPAIVNGKSYANQHVLLERSEASGWQVIPLPAGPSGGPLSPDLPSSVYPARLLALGGRATAAGGVVLLTDGGIVARDPGGQPQRVPAPDAQVSPAVLGAGESLPPSVPPEQAPTPFAAIDDMAAHDGARHTGLLIAPYHAGVQSAGTEPRVLHYDGTEWTPEPIAPVGVPKPGFAPEAIACGGTAAEAGASSPSNCWLLAAYKSEASVSAPDRLALFKRRSRVPTASDPSLYKWEEEQMPAGPPVSLLGEPTPSSGEPLSVSALAVGAQMLTVTAQGVWVDFQAKLGGNPNADVSELVVPSPGTSAPAPLQAERVLGPWCYPAATPVCPPSSPTLGAPFPTAYGSSAWPGSGVDPGTRILSGLPHGARLELSGGGFSYEVGAGGEITGAGGAAFGSPGQGVIGSGGVGAQDQQGGSQVIDVTPQPQGDQLQEVPVPFRYPLLAVTQAPGSTPGDAGAQAVAVGVRGEIGRYVPAQGWRPESLYDSAGRVQTPTLRGVAWPTPARAYAVGDNGAMWLWRADTGLWEPDPARPLSFIGNLTAIAFSPSSPNIGYAVGKNGVLLRFGKSWTQEPLPEGLQGAIFTSVTFAAGEPIATYRIAGANSETGGVAIKDGPGWRVDPAASTLLAQLPSDKDTVLSRVAGLPDGGAAAAGPGLVIERDSPTAPWRFSPQPLPEAQNVSALGAYRDTSGLVRALISIDLDPFMNINGGIPLQSGPWSTDVPPPSGPGQPPPFAPADPLPNTGYLLRESSSGWSDMEHMALEPPAAKSGEGNVDMPLRPDPVLALFVDPNGGSGLAVGGQTYDSTGSDNGSRSSGVEAEFQTAAAMRFGAGASAAAGDAPASVAIQAGHATFAVGGEAACGRPCSDFANEGLAPDVSLSHALQSAGQIAASSSGGLRGFLYTGGRLRAQSACAQPSSSCGNGFERELRRYGSLLGASSLPVHVAASPGDRAPEGGGIEPGIGSFASALSPFGPGAGHAYYSFASEGASGGPVSVIVLDYSSGALGAVQQEWLERELAAAKNQGKAAIVMGNAALGFALPDQAGDNPAPLEASDAPTVSGILVRGEASAYLFDYPSANVQAQVDAGGEHIPAFGTGTLGYVSPPGPFVSDFLGSSGFLLLDVDTAARTQAHNRVPVSARVEPNISQLALNATDGVFLRRSQVALFEALARRPPSGVAVNISPQTGGASPVGPAPYDPIPFNCQGGNCAGAMATDYTFTSSNPDIGDFVAHDPTSRNPRQALLGANRLPVADPKSGLFCAFNSGTTTVSITTGGLTYAEPVTVQAGSVEYPCGTVPLKNPPLAEAAAQASFTAPEPPLASSPPSASPQIQGLIPPPVPTPTPQPPHHVIAPHQAAVALLPFLPLVQPIAGARPAIVPPPAPPAARPIPPSGTSQVSQTVGAAEKEREEESATEIASSGKFATYDANRRGGPGPWILVLVVLAAGAGVGIGRGRRSSAREHPALALAAARRRPAE